MKPPVSYQDVVKAGLITAKAGRPTPLHYSAAFSQMVGGSVYFKLENLQKTGSFKVRGACNKVFSLSSEQGMRGVIAASAGNHAQGVAYAAGSAGYPSTIVMPQGVSLAKLAATKGYGAKVVLSGQSYDEAYVAAENLQRETGAVFIHAFNDPLVIAGQGTVGLEIGEQLPDVANVLVPVGGGGLIAGVATALKHINPRVKIVGVQAAGAPAMKRALDRGSISELPRVSTIADGIAVKHPGSLTYAVVRELVDEIVLVNDEEIAQAILMMLERARVLCEGAAAVGVAALMQHRVHLRGNTVVIISGGNIDVQALNVILERGLIKSGRYVRLSTTVLDKPGTLQKLLGVLGESRANVISINHDRILPRIPISQAEVQIDLETRDRGHIEEIIELLQENGYNVSEEEMQ